MPEPDVLSVDAGDGLRLHVEREGHGPPPPLLALHGFTGTGDTWQFLRSALREQCTVITVDAPGHGRSSAPSAPWRYALARYADDLSLVLDAAGAPLAAVLGYSFGGRAALKFALSHPARVAALILESTSPGITDPAERTARQRSDAELVALLEHQGIAAFVDRWERLPLWVNQERLDQATRARLRSQRLSQSARGLALSLRGAGAGEDPPVLDSLRDLQAPTLLIAGALDVKYVGFALRMAERMPSARVEIVPDAGHAVHLERPADYARIVAEFLASLQPGNE